MKADVTPQLRTKGSAATEAALSGKRVLFLVNQDLGGGVEYLARVIGQDLTARGAICRTEFIYPSSDFSTQQKLSYVASAAWRVARNAPDILITFQPTASAVSAIAGLAGGCRRRIVHQSNSPSKSNAVVRELDKLLGSIGAYTVTIANSRATIAEFEHYPNAYRDRILLIEHGIPPPQFQLAPTDILAKFSVPADGPILLTAARLDPQKGQQIIVSALRELPGVRYVMAGAGPEQDALARLAQSFGVADRVHFVGLLGRQDLTDLYRASTLLVFPSVWETFGLAAVEAAMIGLPVIASDIPALREVLTSDGKTTARFVASRSPYDWREAISDSLASPQLSAASAGFATVIQDKYSEQRMIAGYAALYAELFT